MSTLYISCIIIVIIITKRRMSGDVGTLRHMKIVALSSYVSCIDHVVPI